MVAVFYDHLAQLELRLATAGGVLGEDVLLRFVQKATPNVADVAEYCLVPWIAWLEL